MSVIKDDLFERDFPMLTRKFRFVEFWVFHDDGQLVVDFMEGKVAFVDVGVYRVDRGDRGRVKKRSRRRRIGRMMHRHIFRKSKCSLTSTNNCGVNFVAQSRRQSIHKLATIDN